MRGSIADFTLDRLLAIRLSDEDADDGGGASEPRASARGPLATEWAAPKLPAGI